MNNLKDLKISKELFEAVYNCDISTDKDMLCVYKNRNIYEFAFKCKEWAFKKGYTILTEFVNKVGIFSYIVSNQQSIEDYGYLVEDIKVLECLFDSKTEVEAIIKACEWILDQRTNKCTK